MAATFTDMMADGSKRGGDTAYVDDLKWVGR